MSGLANALFNQQEPDKYLLRERPRHRTIVELAQCGHSNREIAAIVGMTPNSVERTLRQPWAAERIVNGIKQTIEQEVKDLLQQQAIPSIKKQIALRDSEDSPKDVQLRASQAILDRLFGKPTQPVETKVENLTKLSDAQLEQIANGDATATSSTNATPAT